MIEFKFRNGARITCHRAEMIGVIEVFVLEEYGAASAAVTSADVVIDVGANVGAATVWFAKAFPGSRVIAVEPSPDAVSLLRYNLTQNDLTPRVTVIPCAVGRVEGRAQLSADAVSVRRRLVGQGQDANSISVSTVTFDRLLEEVEPWANVVVKIDCEGAEWDILDTVPRSSLARVALCVGEYHLAGGRTADQLVAAFGLVGFRCETHPHRREPELGTFIARPQSSL